MKRLFDKLLGAKTPPPRTNKKSAADANREKPTSPFRAVGIKFEANNCCNQARQLVGKRFLINEAPLLRLPDCSNPNCGCSYVNYPDRRVGPRRDRDEGYSFDIQTQWGDDRERRQSRGRRAHDLTWAR